MWDLGIQADLEEQGILDRRIAHSLCSEAQNNSGVSDTST